MCAVFSVLFREFVEGEFSEVGLPLEGFLGSCARACNPAY
jgi:hypothetical protein